MPQGDKCNNLLQMCFIIHVYGFLHSAINIMVGLCCGGESALTHQELTTVLENLSFSPICQMFSFIVAVPELNQIC